MKKDVTAKDANDAKKELLFKDECYAIQGAVFNVYHEMGCGFLEAVYQECLEREFIERSIPFHAQIEMGRLPPILSLAEANERFRARRFPAPRGYESAPRPRGLPRCTSGMELHQKRWKPLLKARLARLGGFSTVPRRPLKSRSGSGGKPDQWDTGCPCWQRI